MKKLLYSFFASAFLLLTTLTASATYNVFPTNEAGGINFTQIAQTGGLPKAFYISSAANTAGTAGQAWPLVQWELSTAKEWATGAVAVTYDFYISSSNYKFVGASTVSLGANLFVAGGPGARTNATITNAVAIMADNWQSNAESAYNGVFGIPGIEAAKGNVTERAGLAISDILLTTFGDQTANITNIYGIKVPAVTISGTANTRTITGNLASVYIAGTPTVGANMAFAGTPYSLFVDAGAVRFDGGGTMTGTWTDLGTVTTIDINGGTLDGVTIGGASAAAITGTAITGTSFVIGANTLTTSEWAFLDGQNQAVTTTSNPTFGNLTITSFAANWTNAGRTIADLGTITTTDINGGTIDGTTIGGTARAAGSFTTIGVDSAITGIVSSALAISIPTRATDAAANDFTISGQGALVQVAASANPNGANLILQGGNANTSDTTGGSGGNVRLQPGKKGQFGDGAVQFYDNKTDLNLYGTVRLESGLSDFFIDSLGTSYHFSVGYGSAGNFYRSFRVQNISTAVDYVQISGAAAAGNVLIEAAGSDAAIQLNLKSKSTDGIFFGNSTDIGILSHTGFAFDKATTVTFSQNIETTNVATSDMTFNAQDAYASATGANRDAPDFVFSMGTAASGGVSGSFLINSSSGNPMFGVSDGSGTISQTGQYNTAYEWTSDATTTGAGTDTFSLFGQGTSNDSAITVKGSVNAVLSDGSKVAMYTFNAGYKNDGGVLSEVYDTTSTDYEDNALLSAVIAPSGTDIVVTVTGAITENYTWAADFEITEVAL